MCDQTCKPKLIVDIIKCEIVVTSKPSLVFNVGKQ